MDSIIAPGRGYIPVGILSGTLVAAAALLVLACGGGAYASHRPASGGYLIEHPPAGYRASYESCS